MALPGLEDFGFLERLRACFESYVAPLQVNGRIPREALEHNPYHRGI